MTGYVNKAIICGRLGRDPETRTLQNGGKTTSFSVATSETWNDKASGERKSRTQWHNVVIWNEKLGEIADRYLKKGSAVFLEGAIESRKYTTKEGVEREVTEIILSKFKGELVLMDSAPKSGDDAGERAAPARREAAKASGPSWDAPGKNDDLDSEIPF